MIKLAIYFLSFILIIYSIDALNINTLFKQGRILKARIIYFLIVISMTYLVSNFFYDIYLSIVSRGTL